MRFWNSSVDILNIRAVYAFRRAISAVCAVAFSSRSMTSTCPARSTTTADVLKPLALHSASVASAIVLAMARDIDFCVTRLCAASAMLMPAKISDFMTI